MRLLAPLLLAYMFAPAAEAAPSAGCFTRTYDEAHLAAHKGQSVKAVTLYLTPQKSEPPLTMAVSLKFRFRDRTSAYYAVGACSEAGDTAECGLDQDGGRIRVSARDRGVLLAPLQDLRVDSESGDESDYVAIPASNPENRAFVLSEVAAENCQEFEDSGTDEAE